MNPEPMERVLLLGGPCDWRTTAVRMDQYELLIPLPIERPLVMAQHEMDMMSSSPMADLKVARYTRAAGLALRGKLVGHVFEYEETM